MRVSVSGRDARDGRSSKKSVKRRFASDVCGMGDSGGSFDDVDTAREWF